MTQLLYIMICIGELNHNKKCDTLPTDLRGELSRGKTYQDFEKYFYLFSRLDLNSSRISYRRHVHATFETHQHVKVRVKLYTWAYI